jgi:hypothetical protein
VAFETTAAKLWKRLPPEERLAAASAFWKEPPQELLGAAVGAVIRARRIRPQVARQMPPEELARILATVIDPGEALAAALLVALHLSDRRALLATFLDALGLPHEDGLIKDEPGPQPPALTADQARPGLDALLAAYPAEQVRVYFNTLWLQDPERWGVLSEPPFAG